MTPSTRDRRTPFWIRCTSLGTCLAFVYVHVASAALPPAAFWSERRDSVQAAKADRGGPAPESRGPVQLAQLPPADLSPLAALRAAPAALPFPETAVPLQGGRLPACLRALPADSADLKELYLPPHWKPGDLLVVHIQDAHRNVPAQRNIAAVLAALADAAQAQDRDERAFEPGLSPIVVGIEGARGGFNFQPYRRFPDQNITGELARYFLAESLITGPEYAGMTCARLPLFWGVEDEALYLRHVSAFKAAVPEEARARDAARGLSQAADRLKARIFHPELREFDRRMSEFRRDGRGLSRYLEFLCADARTARGPMAARFLEALRLERSLDYVRVDEQRKELAARLAERLPKRSLEALAAASLAYRTGGLSGGAFYGYFKKLCADSGTPLSRWPEMERYVRYAILRDQIQPERLFGELEALEARRIRELARTPEERKLVELSRDVALLGRLFEYSLGAREWESFRLRRTEIEKISRRIAGLDPGARPGVSPEALKDLVGRFARFQEAAEARNAPLVENLLARAAAGVAASDFIPQTSAGVTLRSVRVTPLATRYRPDGRPLSLALKTELLAGSWRNTLEVAIAEKGAADPLGKDEKSAMDIDLPAYRVRVRPWKPGWRERASRLFTAAGEPATYDLAASEVFQKASAESEKKRKVALAVLVAGGFHSEAIARTLKRRGIAYAVLTPRMDRSAGNGADYLNVFRRGPTPLEKIFTGERITLAPPSDMADQPVGGGLSQVSLPEQLFFSAVPALGFMEDPGASRGGHPWLFPSLPLARISQPNRPAAGHMFRSRPSGRKGGALKNITDSGELELDDGERDALLDYAEDAEAHEPWEKDKKEVGGREMSYRVYMIRKGSGDPDEEGIAEMLEETGGAFHVRDEKGRVLIFLREGIPALKRARQHELFEAFWMDRLEREHEASRMTMRNFEAQRLEGFSLRQAAHILAWGYQIRARNWPDMDESEFFADQFERILHLPEADRIRHLRRLFAEDRARHAALRDRFLKVKGIDFDDADLLKIKLFENTVTRRAGRELGAPDNIISIAVLRNLGPQAVLFDLDDTLVAYNGELDPESENARVLLSLLRSGVRVAVITGESTFAKLSARLDRFADAVQKAAPFTRGGPAPVSLFEIYAGLGRDHYVVKGGILESEPDPILTDREFDIALGHAKGVMKQIREHRLFKDWNLYEGDQDRNGLDGSPYKLKSLNPPGLVQAEGSGVRPIDQVAEFVRAELQRLAKRHGSAVGRLSVEIKINQENEAYLQVAKGLPKKEWGDYYSAVRKAFEAAIDHFQELQLYRSDPDPTKLKVGKGKAPEDWALQVAQVAQQLLRDLHLDSLLSVTVGGGRANVRISPISKAAVVRRLGRKYDLNPDRVVFFGDSLQRPFGNDASVLTAGILTAPIEGPDETGALLKLLTGETKMDQCESAVFPRAGANGGGGGGFYGTFFLILAGLLAIPALLHPGGAALGAAAFVAAPLLAGGFFTQFDRDRVALHLQFGSDVRTWKEYMTNLFLAELGRNGAFDRDIFDEMVYQVDILYLNGFVRKCPQLAGAARQEIQQYLSRLRLLSSKYSKEELRGWMGGRPLDKVIVWVNRAGTPGGTPLWSVVPLLAILLPFLASSHSAALSLLGMAPWVTPTLFTLVAMGSLLPWGGGRAPRTRPPGDASAAVAQALEPYRRGVQQLTLRRIQLYPRGALSANYAGFQRDVFRELPARPVERPENFPKREAPDLDRLPRFGADDARKIELPGIRLSLRNPYRVLGRTLIFRNGDKYVHVKFLKQGEDPAALAYESDVMEYLRSRQSEPEWDLLGHYPSRVVRLGKMSGRGIAPEIEALVRRDNDALLLDSGGGELTFMAYEVESDRGFDPYAVYLNDPDLDPQDFRRAYAVNVHDRFVMARHGLFDLEIIELYHTISLRRRYNWMASLGAGEVEDFVGATQYPNLRLSGPADLAELYSIDDLLADPKFRGVFDDDELERLLKRSEGSAKNYVMAALLGDTLLSLALMPPTYLERRGELNFDVEDARAGTELQAALRTLFDRSYEAYNRSPAPYRDSEWTDLRVRAISRQMAYFMTSRYADDVLAQGEIRKDVFAPGTEVHTSHLAHPSVYPWDIHQRVHAFRTYLGRALEMRSRDLGPYGAVNPLPDLVRALFLSTTLMVAGKYAQEAASSGRPSGSSPGSWLPSLFLGALALLPLLYGVHAFGWTAMALVLPFGAGLAAFTGRLGEGPWQIGGPAIAPSRFWAIAEQRLQVSVNVGAPAFRLDLSDRVSDAARAAFERYLGDPSFDVESDIRRLARLDTEDTELEKRLREAFLRCVEGLFRDELSGCLGMACPGKEDEYKGRINVTASNLVEAMRQQPDMNAALREMEGRFKSLREDLHMTNGDPAGAPARKALWISAGVGTLLGLLAVASLHLAPSAFWVPQAAVLLLVVPGLLFTGKLLSRLFPIFDPQRKLAGEYESLKERVGSEADRLLPIRWEGLSLDEEFARFQRGEIRGDRFRVMLQGYRRAAMVRTFAAPDSEPAPGALEGAALGPAQAAKLAGFLNARELVDLYTTLPQDEAAFRRLAERLLGAEGRLEAAGRPGGLTGLADARRYLRRARNLMPDGKNPPIREEDFARFWNQGAAAGSALSRLRPNSAVVLDLREASDADLRTFAFLFAALSPRGAYFPILVRQGMGAEELDALKARFLIALAAYPHVAVHLERTGFEDAGLRSTLGADASGLLEILSRLMSRENLKGLDLEVLTSRAEQFAGLRGLAILVLPIPHCEDLEQDLRAAETVLMQQ